jgi:hypothetical protein
MKTSLTTSATKRDKQGTSLFTRTGVISMICIIGIKYLCLDLYVICGKKVLFEKYNIVVVLVEGKEEEKQ